MDPAEPFRKLFEYDLWANRRVLESLMSLSGSGERPLQLFAHVLEAQRIWLDRLEQQPGVNVQPWPARSLDECRATTEELGQRWSTFIDGLTGEKVEAGCSYRTTQGKAFETRVGEILTHVILHSMHHRGQVAAAVRAAGGTPAATDYIVYARQTPRQTG